MNTKTTLFQTLSLAVGLTLATATQAQVVDRSSRMIGTIYGNAQLRYNEATTTTSGGTRASFELQRAYLGYQHAFNEQWVGRVLFDITNDASLKGSHYSVYVKHAYICYTRPTWQVYAGMIPTDLYTDAETHWGKRYLLMNVNELSGFGSSADIGASVCYTPSEAWELRAQFINGEGYRRVQADSSIKASLSVGYKPSKAMAVRLYGDVMNTPINTQYTTNLFVGYTHPKLRLGVEGGLQFNQGGAKGYNVAVASLWGTYHCSPKVDVYLRGDLQQPTADGQNDAIPNAWRDNKVQYRAVAGVDLALLRQKGTHQVRLSPNVQWTRTYIGHDQVVGYLSLGAFF